MAASTSNSCLGCVALGLVGWSAVTRSCRFLTGCELFSAHRDSGKRAHIDHDQELRLTSRGRVEGRACALCHRKGCAPDYMPFSQQRRNRITVFRLLWLWFRL